MSETLTIAVRDLRVGDVLPLIDRYPYPLDTRTVVGIQQIGPVVIIDFADNTATPPVAGNQLITVERHDG